MSGFCDLLLWVMFTNFSTEPVIPKIAFLAKPCISCPACSRNSFCSVPKASDVRTVSLLKCRQSSTVVKSGPFLTTTILCSSEGPEREKLAASPPTRPDRGEGVLQHSLQVPSVQRPTHLAFGLKCFVSAVFFVA